MWYIHRYIHTNNCIHYVYTNISVYDLGFEMGLERNYLRIYLFNGVLDTSEEASKRYNGLDSHTCFSFL